MKRFVGFALLAVGCGGDPVDAEGTWTISGTNRANDCMIENWTVDDTFDNVTLVVTQNGSAANADVTGGGGFYLDLLLGGNDIFTGTVDGNDVDLAREGTRSMTQGNCTFTYNAQLLMAIDGDVMTGRINYRSAHNNNSDCAAITCVSYQDLTGIRPPR